MPSGAVQVDRDGPVATLTRPERRNAIDPTTAAALADAVASNAVFGVFNRRYGVPLVDGGTQRVPKIVGLGRALALILTGRPVDAAEAKQIGLATRVGAPGTACVRAIALADELAALSQPALRSDRQAVYEGLGAAPDKALRTEAARGRQVLQQTNVATAAERFVEEADGATRCE